tara:strand:+ start:12490 stop:12939 length:450 start_codon:yes stop_codon:yes gene_type:complete
MNEPLTPRMKQEEPSSELVTSVFVYGTLKSGGPVRGLDSFPVDHRELQGKAKTTYPDYHMHDLGAFPAVTRGKHYIQGEVWKVSKWVEGQIDDIEGYSDENSQNMYNKINVETSIGPAKMYIMDIESAQSWAREPVNAIKDGDTFIWNL